VQAVGLTWHTFDYEGTSVAGMGLQLLQVLLKAVAGYA
jgi:hypothetical protein